MRLAKAASYFDKTLCQDAFVPATTFLGQLDVFDDSKRDGATVVRRVLSMSPSVTLPARRVLTINGEQWIVGQNQDDHWRGAALRRKHVLQRADGAAAIKTVAEVLLAAAGVATYGARLWVKDLKEIEVSSSLNPFYNVYLPSPEVVAAGQVISLAGRLYMVRGTFLSAAAFLVAESTELAADAVVAGTYKRKTAYDPASDAYTNGDTAVTALRIRFQDDYAYTSQAAEKFAEGDVKAYVRKAVVAAVGAGDEVDLGGVLWHVFSVNDEGLCHGLHLRRAGT